VGIRKPNGLGAYDMSGNMWEFVEDCLHVNYKGGPTNGSPWLEGEGGDCSWRMRRGGSFNAAPSLHRSSFRTWMRPDSRSSIIGFRLAQDLD
jgi:formylglycine-generating enzyme